MSAVVSILPTLSAGVPAETRVAAYDWQALTAELDGFGCAVLPKLFSPEECLAVAGLYPDESHNHQARLSRSCARSRRLRAMCKEPAEATRCPCRRGRAR